MAFDHKKYQNITFDVGTTLYGVGCATWIYFMVKEPIKRAWAKHKLKKVVKKLDHIGNELILAENEGLRKENEELLRKNQELIDQIPKTEEA